MGDRRLSVRLAESRVASGAAAANPQELAETMDEALLMRERERRERHKYCLGCAHAMRLCV